MRFFFFEGATVTAFVTSNLSLLLLLRWKMDFNECGVIPDGVHRVYAYEQNQKSQKSYVNSFQLCCTLTQTHTHTAAL